MILHFIKVKSKLAHWQGTYTHLFLHKELNSGEIFGSEGCRASSTFSRVDWYFNRQCWEGHFTHIYTANGSNMARDISENY